MKYLLKLALLILLFSPMPVSAHYAEKGNLQIIHPWVDAGEEGENVIVHPTFSNDDEVKTYIITGATTDAAESIQFLKEGNVIENITLKPDDILTDEDITVQLVNLHKKLEIGQVISMTIHFNDGTKLEFKLGVGKETMPE